MTFDDFKGKWYVLQVCNTAGEAVDHAITVGGTAANPTVTCSDGTHMFKDPTYTSGPPAKITGTLGGGDSFKLTLRTRTKDDKTKKFLRCDVMAHGDDVETGVWIADDNP